MTSEEDNPPIDERAARVSEPEPNSSSAKQGSLSAASASELDAALTALKKVQAQLQEKFLVAADLAHEAEELQFPVQAVSGRTAITRKKKFHAWGGKPDRLTRVSNIVEEALRRGFEDAKPEIKKQPRYLRESLVRRFTPETRVQGGALERRGELASILSDMDAREIKWVQLGNDTPSSLGGEVPSVSVTFGREPKYKTLGGGVTVEVNGSDKQWVAATYDSLANELVKGVPWWSRLIADSAFVGYLLLAAAIVYGAAIAWLPKPFEVATSLSLAFTAFGLGSIFFAVARWLLPNFELVEPGGSSRARKAGTFFILLVGLVSGMATIWAFVRH